MNRAAWLRASVLLLLLVLLAPPAFAGRRDAARPAAEIHGVFAWLWHSLGELVPAVAKGRGTIDPNGTPEPPAEPTGDSTTTTEESETEGRGTIDPDG